MSKRNNNQQQGRKRFRIQMDEYETFPDTSKTAFLTSKEFCEKVSELFHNVFADFEGCMFSLPQPGQPGGASINLVFNHGNYDDDAIVACTRSGIKITGNRTLDNYRNTANRYSTGDRYYLTDDGKDVIMGLLTPQRYNGGNPRWKNIVVDVTDQNSFNMYYRSQASIPQNTHVMGLDLARLCGLIYGTEVDGIHYDYSVNIANFSQVGGFQPNNLNNYLLSITRIDDNRLLKIFEKMGMGNMGSNIIR